MTKNNTMSTYSDITFSDSFDRKKMMGITGKTALRIETLSRWDELFPYGLIPASRNPHFFEKKIIPLDISYEHEDVQRSLEEYMKEYWVGGLMVLRGGEVVYEQYKHGINEESRYHIMSATKSFTSTIIGMALYEGMIKSIDDLAKDYAPQFEGTAYGDVSIRHLLMMSSGINYFHNKGFPDRQEAYRQVFLEGRDFDDFAAERDFRVPPGTDFNYIATDTQVLSEVLRGAYDKPYHTIIKERLWGRIGMAGSTFLSRNAPEGHGFGAFGLCPRLIEFAHLGQLYLNDGVWDGERLLPEDWVRTAGTPQAPFQEPTSRKLGYGYQFWVPPNYKSEFMARGAFGQWLWIDIERDVIIAQISGYVGDTQLMDRRGKSDPDPDDDMEPFAVFRAIVDAVI